VTEKRVGELLSEFAFLRGTPSTDLDRRVFHDIVRNCSGTTYEGLRDMLQMLRFEVEIVADRHPDTSTGFDVYIDGKPFNHNQNEAVPVAVSIFDIDPGARGVDREWVSDLFDGSASLSPAARDSARETVVAYALHHHVELPKGFRMWNIADQRTVAGYTVNVRYFEVARITWRNSDGLSFDVTDQRTGLCLTPASLDHEPGAVQIADILETLRSELEHGTLDHFYIGEEHHVREVTGGNEPPAAPAACA
jgi:hypothetical protein